MKNSFDEIRTILKHLSSFSLCFNFFKIKLLPNLDWNVRTIQSGDFYAIKKAKYSRSKTNKIKFAKEVECQIQRLVKFFKPVHNTAVMQKEERTNNLGSVKPRSAQLELSRSLYLEH